MNRDCKATLEIQVYKDRLDQKVPRDCKATLEIQVYKDLSGLLARKVSRASKGNRANLAWILICITQKLKLISCLMR